MEGERWGGGRGMGWRERDGVEGGGWGGGRDGVKGKDGWSRMEGGVEDIYL